MAYQLLRPSIETIIDYCGDLLADEKLEVYEFGQNCDLVLHIYRSRKIITKEKIMRIKDLIEQLSMYEENSEGKNERSDYNLYKRKQNYQKRV